MISETFVYSIYINCTPEKLWKALTTSEFMRQYWGGRTIESDWKVGSSIKSVQPQAGGVVTVEGKVLKSDPPKLLSYTGIGSSEVGKAIVTFEILQMLPTQVRLNVTHESIDDNMKTMVREGWYAILSSLKSLLETGNALDYSWWRG